MGLGFASLGKGGGTDVPEGLTSLEHRKGEILNSDNFLVLRQLTFQNDKEVTCHPEPAAKSVETKSKPHFMPLHGISVSRCIKSPLPPFTKGGKSIASIGKGGGTGVPEGFSLHSANNRKAAFTLAEVLITLGIIGIVAAMTLPALMANGRKQETVARLKKFNSMMLQAILLSKNDNGPYEYWNNRDYLLNTCKSKGSEIGNSGACARLIEFDGWEIRDDYPFKI